MKHLSIFTIGLAFLSFSCNNSSDIGPQSSETDTTASGETGPVLPPVNCYAAVSGKDSFFLKTIVDGDRVTGNLLYHFAEKDNNTGTITGKLNGDTLFADYTFMSEGQESVREVIFFIKNGTATEGFGSMREKEGKMVFTDRSAIDFTKSKTLVSVPCNHQ